MDKNNIYYASGELDEKTQIEFEEIIDRCGLYSDGKDSVAEVIFQLLITRDIYRKTHNSIREDIQIIVSNEISEALSSSNIALDVSEIKLDINYDMMAKKIYENMKADLILEKKEVIAHQINSKEDDESRISDASSEKKEISKESVSGTNADNGFFSKFKFWKRGDSK